jgi:AcrR family transcriptional regulator
MAVAAVRARRTSPSRQQAHAETCAAILRAAQDILSHEGLVHLSMRSLGRSVGLNAASLYGYFPSKDAVIAALFDDKLATISAVLDEERQRSGPGLARIVALASAYRRFVLENPDYCAMFETVMDGSFERGAQWRERSLEAVLGYRADIEEAIRIGDLPPRVNPERAVIRLWIALYGYVALETRHFIGRAPGRDDSSETEFLDYVGMLIAGLGAGSADAIRNTR